MLKFRQNKYHPHRFIKTLASQLKATSRTDCLEEILELPDKYGTGILTGFDFSDGISLLLFDCTFKEDWVILFDNNNLFPLQFNFSVKGGVKHFFNHHDIQYYLNALQGTITANPQDSRQTGVSVSGQ